MQYALVFVGGGLGSLLRYGLSEILRPWAFLFPWATLLANALSCVLLGLVATLCLNGQLSQSHRLFFITGICGGFSTYSTFTNETFLLLQAGNITLGILNIMGNLILCLLCLILGFKIAGFM